jgi:hypothetical protein
MGIGLRFFHFVEICCMRKEAWLMTQREVGLFVK